MSKSNVPSLMIVTGDDILAIESSLDDYAALVKNAHGRDAAIKFFDAANDDVNTFMADAMTASMFSEVRMFCIPRVHAFNDKMLSALSDALDYKIPDVYIHVSAEVEKKDKQKAKLEKILRLKERAKDAGVVVKEASKPYENKIAAWIVERAQKKYRRKITTQDAQILADNVEYNFIDSELRKIDMALPDGAAITKSVIEEIVGVTRSMTVYELSGALAKRDLVTALTALDSLLCSGFYAPLFASAVFRHFWTMLKIRKYLEKNPDMLRQYNQGGWGADSPQSHAAFEIGKAVGILSEKDSAKSAYPKIILPGVVTQSQKFTDAGLRKILKLLQRFDVDSKTGGVSVTPVTMQMLCYKIVRTG